MPNGIPKRIRSEEIAIRIAEIGAWSRTDNRREQQLAPIQVMKSMSPSQAIVGLEFTDDLIICD